MVAKTDLVSETSSWRESENTLIVTISLVILLNWEYVYYFLPRPDEKVLSYDDIF